MKVKVTMYMDITDEEESFYFIKQIEDHAEWLLDLDGWPEIESVYNVSVEKEE